MCDRRRHHECCGNTQNEGKYKLQENKEAGTAEAANVAHEVAVVFADHAEQFAGFAGYVFLNGLRQAGGDRIQVAQRFVNQLWALLGHGGQHKAHPTVQADSQQHHCRCHHCSG